MVAWGGGGVKTTENKILYIDPVLHWSFSSSMFFNCRYLVTWFPWMGVTGLGTRSKYRCTAPALGSLNSKKIFRRNYSQIPTQIFTVLYDSLLWFVYIRVPRHV